MKVSLLLFLFLHKAASFVVPTPFAVVKRRASLFKSKDSDAVDLDQVASALGAAGKQLAKQATDKVNELTNKDSYEFGDLTKLLDTKARAAVADLTNKEEADWTDVMALVNTKAKELTADMEAKEEWKQLKELSMVAGSRVQSQFQDLMGKDADLERVQEVATKEIVELLKNRQYGIGDLFFLLKLCTSFGLGMNPAVMAIFPLNVLIQLYNLSLIQEAGQGVTTAVAMEMDRRARSAFALELEQQTKTALFGDPDAEVGALFKKAVLGSIDQEQYDFGAITKNLMSTVDSGETPEPIGVTEDGELEPELEKELEALDKAMEVVDVEVVDDDEADES
jgi:hypothetical protein